MPGRNWAIAVALLVCVGLLPSRLLIAQSTSAASNPHSYFDALVARAEAWKSYSLRDQVQLDLYKTARTARAWVTYDPANDTYPRRQDAAKVVVPLLDPQSRDSLASPATASDGALTVTAGYNGLYTHTRALKIDNEIMLVNRPSGSTIGPNGTVLVNRGQHGTAAASHAAGAPIFVSTNSLINYVRLPLGTQDGHTYLFTWDSWSGSEIHPQVSGLDYYKHFQFADTQNSVWYEVRTRFNLGVSSDPTDLGPVDGRYYGTVLGPNVLKDAPVASVGSFKVRANKWTRYWVLLNQQAGTYDTVSLWVADETTGPVQVHNDLQFEVTNGGVGFFWLEFNTSLNTAKAGRPDITAYVRNFVALRDVANPTSLMVKPTSGNSGPMPPTNVRIIVP
jgi:hypothetical protein